MTKEEILTAIESMTVKELNELVKAFEEKFGVSAAFVPGPSSGGSASAGTATATAPEKTTLSVVLKSAGQQKVQLIKKIKEITGKGLKECKDLVDKLPAVVKDGLDDEEAKRIASQLTELGAEVELK